MSTNLDRYKSEIDALVALGKMMQSDLQGRVLIRDGKVHPEAREGFKKLEGTFEREYQGWYTLAGALIRQLIPERLVEFQELYKGDGKRKEISSRTYHIQDWLNGVGSGTSYAGVSNCLEGQAFCG